MKHWYDGMQPCPKEERRFWYKLVAVLAALLVASIALNPEKPTRTVEHAFTKPIAEAAVTAAYTAVYALPTIIEEG